ncbi:MAG TPA: pilin [Nevskiaceae bacterium]|nr:pilin [Nevskiaceae bacterium]
MITELLTRFGAACPGGDFLGFPKWYKYLNGTPDPNTHLCTPQLSGLSDLWLILAAIIEDLLRLVALFAVALVIWGGIQFISSQGDPGATTKARQTILNAIIGLVIAILAATVVAFIAGRFK